MLAKDKWHAGFDNPRKAAREARTDLFSKKVKLQPPCGIASTMYPDTSAEAATRVSLSRLVGGMHAELRYLLGPAIRLETDRLRVRGPASVQARHEEIVDLLRHLALDAHDAMPAGGEVTIRTGRLRDVETWGAIVIHEAPDAPAGDRSVASAGFRKGRSLGLGACYDAIERVGGHFHVSCGGRETVLTICFRLAA